MIFLCKTYTEIFHIEFWWWPIPILAHCEGTLYFDLGNFHKDVVNVQIFQLYPPWISIMILPLDLTAADQYHVTAYTNEHTVAERTV